MATTQADLDALDAGIASGIMEIRFQDRLEHFQSVQDMLVARAFLYSQLHPPSVYPGIRRRIQMVTSSGF